MSASSGKRGLNVYIDPNRCVGNAACTWAAPGFYVLDEETRKAVLEHEEEATVEQLFAGARACPTRAISFGDLNRRDSAVSRLRREPHHYALLGHLGTRPRTTYLKRVRNPNPALEEGGA